MDLKYLTEEERSRFLLLQKLFESDGYAELVRDLRDTVAALREQLEFVESFDQLRYLKGYMDGLRYVIDYQTAIEGAVSAVLMERQEDVEIDV